MAKAIEFYLRGPVPKKVKQVPIEQRGKLVEFPKENIAALPAPLSEPQDARSSHFDLRHNRHVGP